MAALKPAGAATSAWFYSRRDHQRLQLQLVLVEQKADVRVRKVGHDQKEVVKCRKRKEIKKCMKAASRILGL